MRILIGGCAAALALSLAAGVVSAQQVRATTPGPIFLPIPVPVPASSQHGAFLGVSLEPGPRDGASVLQVIPGSPADRAGLQPGDVIVRIDGVTVKAPGDVVAFMGGARTGDAVTLELERAGKPLSLRVTLDTFSADPRAFRQGRDLRFPAFGGHDDLAAANRRIDELERRLEKLEQKR